jgi:hypothetical protein
MLRILPTKEIKVFHSPSQVGLAYMVVGLLERKKRIFFRQVTLVVEAGMSPVNSHKRGIFDPNLIPPPERIGPYNPKISSGFPSSI